MTEKVIETQYGWYQKNDDKVNVDEIIGIVKTDEQTNSVQLKKEAQLSICEKRVLELEKENEQLKSEKKDMQILINTISDQRNEFHRGARENANRVGKLEKENKQLKSELAQIKRQEQEVIEYLQAYHKGDVKELKE